MASENVWAPWGTHTLGPKDEIRRETLHIPTVSTDTVEVRGSDGSSYDSPAALVRLLQSLQLSRYL